MRIKILILGFRGLTSLPPHRLSSKLAYLAYFLVRFQSFSGYKQMYFVVDNAKKVDNIHRAICCVYSCISSVQF